MLQYIEENRKFGYLDTAIAAIEIDMDVQGCFARVMSEYDGSYKVRIDEDTYTATSCSCDDHFYRKHECKHMTAVNLFYLRIQGIFHGYEVAVCSLEQAMQEAQDAVVEMIEEAATTGDKSYDEAMTAVYETLATTKKVTHAYGCCGHLVKFEDAGELCGACRCR